MKKPFAWYGGKEALAPLLVSLLPRHKVYCEVFGGSGALLFAKAPGGTEILNDLDSGVVNFFHVLRDPEMTQSLQHLLERTPYAREEYYTCLHSWEAVSDPVEKARRWFTAVMQSMNASIRATGWSSSKQRNPAQDWISSIGRLTACAKRLARVQIDHRDFETVIRAYDSPETCFYLDPPYLAETRSKGAGCYRHEMNLEDHRRLLSCLLEIKGMALLSGYANPLYAEALVSWECITLTVQCSAMAHTRTREARYECIWLNPACARYQCSLFGFPELREEVSL